MIRESPNHDVCLSPPVLGPAGFHFQMPFFLCVLGGERRSDQGGNSLSPACSVGCASLP